MPEPEQLSEEKNILILHGDDGFSVEREIKHILAGLGSPTEIDMNSLRLDLKTASLDEIHNALTALPFFGSRRVVVLINLMTKLDKTRQEKLLKTLEAVPSSTTAVLVAEDHQRWRKSPSGSWEKYWETLTSSNWLMKWAAEHPQVQIREFPLPDNREMPNWITREVKELGGKIEADAAGELAAHVGNETSIASQEIAKLLTYVNSARPVTREDVMLLVSESGSADAFAMTDALAEGRSKEAQQMMRTLLDDNPPEVVLGAIIFRFRQLIQVREALDAGDNLQSLVEKRIVFGGKQLDAIQRQARRFSLTALKAIYRHLLEIDLQAKTSQVDLASNLEMLVMELK